MLNFAAYCRMDPLSDAKKVNLLPLSQLNVWLTSARILDMSRVTTTDTGLFFFKFRKRAISYEELLVFVKDLTSTKGLDLEDTKKKMQTCGIPVHPRDFKVKTDKK